MPLLYQKLDLLLLVHSLLLLFIFKFCLVNLRLDKKNDLWPFLASFFLFYALKIMVDIVALSGYEAVPLSRCFAAIAFLSLMEYARSHTTPIYSSKYWKWNTVGLALLSALVFFVFGAKAFDVVVRYLLCLVGGLWASITILRVSKEKRSMSPRWSFYVISLSLAGFCLTQFFELGDLKYLLTLHEAGFGIGIWLVLSGMLFTLCLFVISNVCFNWNWAVSMSGLSRINYLKYMSFLLLIIGGWLLTERLSYDENERLKESLLTRAKIASVVVDPESASRLSALKTDENKPEYKKIRELLMQARAASGDVRFLYLFMIKGDKVLFQADCEDKKSPDYSAPGDLWKDAPSAAWNAYFKGETAIQGPYTDQWGTWTTAFVPIKDVKTNKIVSALGMDVSIKLWDARIMRYRLLGIVACLIVFVLLLVFFVTYELGQISAEELREREDALRASEEKFRSISNAALDAIVMVDSHGNIFLWNQAAERIFGYSEAEALGQNLYQLVMGETHTGMFESFTKTDEGTASNKPVEFIAKHKLGHDIPMEINFSLFLLHGEWASLAVIRDITRRKQDEMLIREKTEDLNRFFDVGLDILCIASTDGYIKRVSKAYERLLGYTAEEAENKPITDFIHPDDVETTASVIAQLSNNIPVTGFINRYRCKDGTYKWLEWYAIPYEGKMIYAAARDITLRKKMEEALRDSENYLETMFNSLQSGVAVVEAETFKIIDINSAGLAMLKVKREDVVGQKCEKYICGANCEQCPVVIKGMDVRERETVFTDSEGTKISILKTAERVELKGKIYILENFVDITKLKEAQRKLEKSERRFRDIAVSTSGLVWEFDANGVYTYCSDNVYKTLGYTPKEFIGLPFIKLIPGDIREEVAKKFAERIKKREPLVDYESRFVRKDGREIIGLVNGTVVLSANGEFLGYRGIAEDITEKKRAEEAIRQLSTAVEQSPAITVITDINGNIEYANRQFTKVTGYTLEEAKGQNPRILKSGETSPEVYKTLWETITTGKEWKGLFLNKKKDGELYWEAASISSIKDQTGKITHYMAVKEDITERKHLEDTLKQTQEELLKAFKMKDEFISITSHDLKSPLGIIKTSMSLLLEEGKLTPTIKEYAELSLRQAHKGLKLITDLLDLKKLESGDVKLELTKFPFSRLVEEVFSDFKFDYDRAGIDLKFHSEHDYEVTADYNKVGQVISNLLTNALKYTSRGGSVGISTSVIQKSDVDSGNREYLKVSVTDTGTGIPVDKMLKIFEKYEQARIMDRKTGTGIGLAIASLVCQLHHGEIWVESEMGKGSTFNFTLPYGT